MNDTNDEFDPFMLPDEATHPATIAERLMRLPEHFPLAEHEVRFGYLMRATPKEKGGKVELGSVHAVKTMCQGAFKDLFAMMLTRLLRGLPDYVIVIDATWWAEASAIEREALVYHELCHVRQATDEYGAMKFDKDGYPVWRLVEHDVAAFNAEVQRYGAWDNTIASFLAAGRAA